MNVFNALKTSITTGLLFASFNTTAQYEQTMPEKEKNACGAVMCLFGGESVGECAEYLDPYYAIEEFAKKAHEFVFDPEATLDARKVFLMICGSVDEETIDKANNCQRRTHIGTGYLDAYGYELTYYDVAIYRIEFGYDALPEIDRYDCE